MILRRVIAHFRKQEWTAIGLDFLIVVVGVFIGIQVANWNEARAENLRETLLLNELRAEIAESIKQVEIKIEAFEQVERSGKRALAFLDSGQSCSDECWDRLVDFFHASQWQSLIVDLSTYEELRRNGWPRNRKIVEAVEAYERQALQIAIPLRDPPAYRALVRGLIPLAAHSPYWTNCFILSDGEEAYVEDCPEGVAPEISAAGIETIANHPDIHRTLTEWAGFVGGFSTTLTDQNAAARRTIALIDAELESRQ
ncbi:hypothetical protein [Hyphococcus sp.]|uniref:hypothetical protein n=1 Tax=Hyphococcus sp. TaxID=2038636 RepID=UPI002089B108|nr:MAG: hypothetical protein DHS20C04_24120 [Marinicaulis sp.]